ncbi:MAG: hypothetical protein AMJ75_09440 [Phycisphaerae bacterium SM1_79]|nr:MAG: hypothetical protein AMJ75_09440 [Phycisphaerae bacterium SM1_79]
MDTQKNGRWTLQDVDTSALRQLIRIKTAKPLNEEGEYSAQTFLDPLFGYIFKRDPNQIQRYEDDKAELHRPLDMIYARSDGNGDGKSKGLRLRDWPPVFWRTDPNSQKLENAIKHGITLFNEYWKDPERLERHSQDYAQVQIIEKLKDAFEKFDTAEARILGLGGDLGLKSDKLYTAAQSNKFFIDWNESFKDLKESKESIDNYIGTLNNPQSLVTLWAEQTKIVLKDVNENYDFLLSELKDVNDAENLFLASCRSELENARQRMKNSLSESEFAQKLDQFDKELYAWVPRDQMSRRLYAIRYEMYSEVNEQLGAAKPISNVVYEVTKAVGDLEEASTKARRNIGQLRDLDPNPAVSRFQQAYGFSNLALSLAEQRQLYEIVKSSLEAAPKSIEELDKLIEKEEKWDWADIPTTIIDKRYDPSAAAAMLGTWKSLGDVLDKQLGQEASHLYEICRTIPALLVQNSA